MDSKKITCYFPIEIITRELDTKVYIVSELIKNGFTCVIGQKGYVRKHMFSLGQPYIYFDKGLSPGSLNKYKKIHQSGGVTAILDEEGGIFSDMNEALLPYHDNIIPYMHIAFLWGEEQKRIILKNRKNASDNNFKVVGYPSFDLLQKDKAGYYRKLKDKIPGTPKPYILVNTNFAHYNGQVNYSEHIDINKKNSFYIGTAEQKDLFYAMIEYQKQVCQHFIQMINKLAEKLVGTDIVVRPHPQEKLESYEIHFKDYNNIIVTRERSVREWIIDAELVIHHDCTTGLESLIMGKPTVSYLPVYDPSMTSFLPIEASKKINNFDDMLKFVENTLKDNIAHKENNNTGNIEKIVPIIANIKGKSIDKIINHIEVNKISWFQNIEYRPNRWKVLEFKLFKYKLLLKNSIKQMWPSNKFDNITQYKKNKFSKLYVQDILERMAILKELDPSIPDISLQKILDNTFMIKPV